MGHVPVFSYHMGAETMDRFIGSFHMPLFMFLSGLVTKTVVSSTTDLSKLVRKIAALMLPLGVFGFCFTLYCTDTSSFSDVPSKVWMFISSNNKMGYWYLFDLALFYATMPLYSLNRRNLWCIDAAIGGGLKLCFL